MGDDTDLALDAVEQENRAAAKSQYDEFGDFSVMGKLYNDVLD